MTAEKRVRELMEEMTLAEKVGQILLYHAGSLGLDNEKRFEIDRLPEAVREKLEAGLGNLFGHSGAVSPEIHAHNTNVLQEFIIKRSRLGIPLLMHSEGLHGIAAYGGTALPQAIGLASTWNPALLREAFKAAGAEMRSRGLHITYNPVLDIATDPRWGRMQETYGEDPYLTAELAVATIEGWQGDDLGRDGIAATAKHFAGYGHPENGRNFAPMAMGMRSFLDRTLRPFEAAVKRARVCAIMAAHHEIDGVPCHANTWLLNDILKKAWGFDGLIVSDADDVYRLYELHHVAASPDEATMRGLTAGVDIDILSSRSYETLERLVGEHPELEAHLDRAVRNVLRLKCRLHLFDNPYVEPERARRINRHSDHQALARRAAEQSLILLKNEDHFLPLDGNALKRLAIIGPNAHPVNYGTYSGSHDFGISVRDGIMRKAADLGIRADCARGCHITRQENEAFTDELSSENATWSPTASTIDDDRELIRKAAEIAAACDTAVVCVGENNLTCREAIYMKDHRGDRDDIELTDSQLALIEAVAATGTPVVLLLLTGRAQGLSTVEPLSRAIVCAWYAGEATGDAVADVLFGEINPGGKLTVTFPRGVGQLPWVYNAKPSARHRHYLFRDTEPLYPFGHGLSFTTFAFENLRMEREEVPRGEPAAARVDVTNTGPRRGAVVAQLYLRDETSSVTRPVRELCGFERVMLDPGASRTLRFEITPDSMAFTAEQHARVIEPGVFIAYAGESSTAELAVRFTVV